LGWGRPWKTVGRRNRENLDVIVCDRIYGFICKMLTWHFLIGGYKTGFYTSSLLNLGPAPLPFKFLPLSLIFSQMNDTWQVQNLKAPNKPCQNHLFSSLNLQPHLSLSFSNPPMENPLPCSSPRPQTFLALRRSNVDVGAHRSPIC
jgi:hypothetical protein